MEHIWKLQEFCNSMIKVETDDYEYAYLKAIVLFSPGECPRQRDKDLCLMCCVLGNRGLTRLNVLDHPGLEGSVQIESFQENALMELQDYVQKTYPDDTYRY